MECENPNKIDDFLDDYLVALGAAGALEFPDGAIQTAGCEVGVISLQMFTQSRNQWGALIDGYFALEGVADKAQNHAVGFNLGGDTR